MAALAAWRVFDVGDRVGGIIFNDQQMEMIRPKRNRKTIQQLLSRVSHFNHLLEANNKEQADHNALNKALHQAVQSCGHDYLVVVMSDLHGFDSKSLRMMTQLKRGNDLIVGWVEDPAEETLSKDPIVLTDGSYQTQVGKGKRLRKEYAKAVNTHKEEILQDFKKYGIPCFPINTEEEVIACIKALEKIKE